MQLYTQLNINRNSREYLILLYVLDGHYHLANEAQSYDLKQGTIFLLPKDQRYSQHTVREGLIAVFYLSYAAICQNLQVDYVTFGCNNLTEQGQKYKKLEQILQNLLMADMKDRRNVYQWKSFWYSLVSLLIEEFQLYEGSSHRQAADENERRLSAIINYIYANYDQPITLSELADRLFVSTSTLSRLFAKEMGQSFVSYVREFRLNKVQEELTNTNKPISRIAIENGFSSPSSMNKDFKSYFGESPSDYRRQFQEQLESQNSSRPDEKDQLAKRLLSGESGDVFFTGVEREGYTNSRTRICVDAASDKGMFPRFQSCLNVGPMGFLMQDSIRDHICRLKKELGITQIRIWNLLSPQMMIIKEKRSSPNFSKLDSFLDFCVENQLDLFFDLAQRENVAMSSEKRLVYQIKDDYVFDSQVDWENFLEYFVRHLLQRYGEERVSRWIFEFTFFLNSRPYYISDRYRSRTVWESGYKIIKRHIPQASVAGPGLRGVYDESFIASVVDDFLSNDNSPDIFTGFYFPYEPTDQIRIYKRLSDPDFLQKEIGLVNDQLAVHHFTGKHIVTDWTAFMGNRNFLNDSCWRGTYILKNVLDNFEQVDGMGIWFASDLINLYSDSDAPLNGIGGLLTRDGIRKPACYAFSFLNQMGRTIVEKGENYLVTKNNQFDLQILCFNYKQLSYYSYLIEENAYKPQELHRLFQDQDVLQLSIRIEHLQKDTTYVVRQNILNEKEGSILNQWIELGCEKDLTAKEMDYLSAKAIPGMYIEHVHSADGTLLLDLRLLPHEMRYILIRPER